MCVADSQLTQRSLIARRETVRRRSLDVFALWAARVDDKQNYSDIELIQLASRKDCYSEELVCRKSSVRGQEGGPR